MLFTAIYPFLPLLNTNNKDIAIAENQVKEFYVNSNVNGDWLSTGDWRFTRIRSQADSPERSEIYCFGDNQSR